jgi:hypothetical protein
MKGLETDPMPLLRWFLVFAFVSTCASAQWLNYIPSGTPLLPNGKPDLSAPAPKALDGRPDLTGVWMHETTTVEDVKRLFGHRFDGEIAGSLPGMEIGTQHKYAFDILADFQPGEKAMTPQGEERYHKALAAHDPTKTCTGVGGFPYMGLLSEPIKIIQSPKVTIVLYEAGYLHRQIFTDGRLPLNEINLPAFLGYSTGHWEGETLVVETTGFNDMTVLDWEGHIHSDALRTTERFHRRNFGNLDYEITLDDPVIYTRPFTIKVPHHLIADNDIFEMMCENEKDAIHMRK